MKDIGCFFSWVCQLDYTNSQTNFDKILWGGIVHATRSKTLDSGSNPHSFVDSTPCPEKKTYTVFREQL